MARTCRPIRSSWASLPATFQPLRRGAIPRGPDIQLYRRLAFGNLVEFNVLDTRQFRSDQACGDGTDVGCADALEPHRSITGAQQERWLLDGLARSHARWKVLAQQVFFCQRDVTAGPPVGLSMDAWDGYRASFVIEHNRPGLQRA